MAYEKRFMKTTVKEVISALTIPLSAALLVMIISSCYTPVATMTRGGESQLMSGDYRGAIDTYTRAINLNPKDAEAYLGRAAAYERLGSFDRSLDDFDHALALLPNDAGVYVDRGLVYELVGDNHLALRDYTRALELDPNNAEARFNCGNVYTKLGDTGRAVENYKVAALLGHGGAQNILKSRGIAWQP